MSPREGWIETSAGLYFVQCGTVAFYDDWDHWRTGFCRLLEIGDETARALIEHAVNSTNQFAKLAPEEKISQLQNSVLKIFEVNEPHPNVPPLDDLPLDVPLIKVDFSAAGMSFDGSAADTVFAKSISGNRNRAIVGRKNLGYAWQVDASTGHLIAADSVSYDKLYFQAPEQAHLGMRNYTSDQDWRLDKARRQFKIASANLGKSEAQKCILDIGSAAGYFRKAAEEAGCTHYGLEQSTDAIEICKTKFGYKTFCGEITDLPALAPQLLGKLDLITLWDVIEHLDDGLSTLNILKQFLNSNGAIAIRTPNLVSHEYDVLKDYYYSFKLDHIKYYSPRSLNALAALSGLRNIYMETTSHLFKGLLGMDYMHQCLLTNTGADIIAMYRRA